MYLRGMECTLEPRESTPLLHGFTLKFTSIKKKKNFGTEALLSDNVGLQTFYPARFFK